MYGYDNAYSDQPGDYGMPNTSNGGPTGVPDPNNPGYDTGGYPLDQSAVAPPITGGTWAPGTPQAGGVTPTFTPAPGSTAAPVTNGAGQTWGAAGPNANFDTRGNPMTFAKTAPGPETGGAAPAPVNLSTGALAPYSEPAPNIPSIPAYEGSQFKTPTMEEALNDPGARARWQRGQESLQNWAAARGTLNDTDTAKMLLDYGQNSEAQDYGNVYARDFGTWQANEQQHQQQYGINRQTQYIDPWTAAYNEWVSKGNFYLNNQGTVANTALGFARL